MSNSNLLQYDFTTSSFVNGVLNDLGNNNYNGKLVNNPSLNQPGPTSSLKSVALNSGQSQYIQLPSFTTPANGMSFSFWFRSNNNPTWARVFDFGNGSNNENIIVFINSNSLGLSVRLGGDTGSSQFNAIPYGNDKVYINDNVWRHIVWTLNPSGTWVLYLNGNSYNTYSGKYYPKSISRTYQYIGRSNWPDPYYNGAIADFRIFNSTLSASNVTNIYNAPNSTLWKYTPSIGNFIKLNGGNIVTTWSNLNIPSSSNMSVSFTINLQNVNSNWRSIFHVTNTNNNCCNIGDRVPAVWITAGAQSLLVVNSISSNGNAHFYSSNLPLNTNIKVDIIWKGQNVKIYFNGLFNTQYNYPSPLAQTNGNANVYIADPWYSTGGFNIQDLTFYNGQSLTFPVSTNTTSSPTWTYPPSVGKAVALSGNNLATNWSNLNIASNSNMSVSFTINIQNVNGNWRNIFHITNTNNDCCNIGDRVPAIWITAGAQTLHICNSTTNTGNDYRYTNNIPLNTDTKIDIVWKGQNVKIYFNGKLSSQYSYSSPLNPANGDANVYIADPWYSTGGFTVKDLTFYNGPSIQPPTSTKPYNYLGCYNDTGNRSIPNYVGNVNSKDECEDYAISNNAALYGVQYYGQCFIGNDISKAAQYGATSNCPDMGGSWTNQIYSTVDIPKPTYNYLGCYNDTGNRAIADQMSIVSSVYDCEQLAKQKGYSVYGLQYGGYCFGSNDINAARGYGLQNDKSQCTTLGGGWTNQVYTNIDNVPPLTNINPNMPASVNSYNYKGCYNNKDNTAISNYRGTVTSVDECSELAFNNQDYIFGVTNNGKCYTGISADQALSQGENYASAYCGTLGSSNTYQVYIRDATKNPLGQKFSKNNISDGEKIEKFSNLDDSNNPKYLYSLKILSIILIIILLFYMMYHIV
jgi:hypothetical protein